MTRSDLKLEEHLGRNLRKRRLAAGLSQRELAETAGLHTSTIGALESGSREPQIDTLLYLCGALRISLTEFFEGAEWVTGEGGGYYRFAEDGTAA